MVRVWLLLLLPLLVAASLGAIVRYLWALITGNTTRCWDIAIAFDDLGNVAGNGTMGQTISSRAAHSRDKLWGRVLCAVLNKINPGHCDRAMTAKNQNLT